MLLAVDIGNTSIKFGLFDGDEIASTHIIPTVRNSTAADIAAATDAWLPGNLSAAIVSSVVPELDATIVEFLENRAPTFALVRATDDLGLAHNFPIDDAGTDRLVNAFAAAELHGVPCVVIAFGTATAIDAISRERGHLGGLIAPGPATSAKALGLVASKLPEVEIAEPPFVIATTTENAIQAGIFYSQIGLVESAVAHIKNEIGCDAKVVATGGFAPLIAAKCRSIDLVEPNLTLLGLKMLYSRRYAAAKND
jgi:type III pantothenate kinase